MLIYKKQLFSILILVLINTIFETHSRSTKTNINSSWKFLSDYNPITACANRTIFARVLCAGIWHTITNQKPLQWNWEKIKLPAAAIYAQNLKNILKKQNINPDNFLWGVGTSAHQVDGGCKPTECNWAQWEQEQCGKLVKEPAGKACDHWHHYKDDIALMKNKLGVNTYRFSVEWSRIEPREGEFNQEELYHYAAVCDELNKQGIKPLVGFHHYTDPIWFLDAGGFEKEKNIKYFVRFCAKVFECLQGQATMFTTFNSPNGYAAKGYLTGITPPGKQNMQLYAEVLKNLLEAHVQIYDTLKKMPGGAGTQIGILHNIHQLDPDSPHNIGSSICCALANMLCHDCIYNFFTSGTFNLYVPTKALVTH
jgi:beta-glucosidase